MFKIKWRSWFNAAPLQAAMEQAGEDLVAKMAEYMLTRARIYAPVDTSYMVGHIEVVNPKGMTAHVVSTAFYSSYVEFGHMGFGTWVPPNPFMRNALADTRAAFPELASQVRLAAPTGQQVSSMIAGAEAGQTQGMGFLGVAIDR